MRRAATFALAMLTALPAAAEGSRLITDRSEFVTLVQGRDLTRLGVRLTVTPDGAITGRAFGKQVTGEWDWRGGYFCRTLNWGDTRAYDRNCQTVQLEGDRLRFTSDKGKGDYARLSLN
ncbi:MAG: dihydrodipicolinate reductase [Pseudooceanicola nanhaiensis]